MILLVKSLNNSILGNLGFKHWYFVDTIKKLVYSYEYEIKGDKFSNGVVKIFEYNEYEHIISSGVEVTKLKYFDLDQYLHYSNNDSTCMDFCFHVLEQEGIVFNTAIESYKEVKKDIKKTGISYFLAFVLGGIIGILSFICIMLLLFDFNFINYI